MNEKDRAGKFLIIPDQKGINRRTFFVKSAGCTAGLALLALPGLAAEGLTAQEEKSIEEIFKELEAKAVQFMAKYMSCSMASFAALNDQFQLKADSTIPALMPFTGGIALRAETCGAVSGSMLALGFFFESISPKGKENPGSSMQHGGAFFDRFEKEFSSTRCRKIQEHLYGRSYDFLNPEEQKMFVEVSQKSGKCMALVKKAVVLAAEIILDHS